MSKVERAVVIGALSLTATSLGSIAYDFYDARQEAMEAYPDETTPQQLRTDSIFLVKAEQISFEVASQGNGDLAVQVAQQPPVADARRRILRNSNIKTSRGDYEDQILSGRGWGKTDRISRAGIESLGLAVGLIAAVAYSIARRMKWTGV